MKLLPTIATLCLVAATSAAQAADPNLGRNLAATCANCHGTNGNARGDMKPLIMHQISKGYTDEQLDLIATYFAAQK